MEDMLSFHRGRIKDRPKLISIVGDKNKIGLDALAKYGPITEVSLDEIFVD